MFGIIKGIPCLLVCIHIKLISLDSVWNLHIIIMCEIGRAFARSLYIGLYVCTTMSNFKYIFCTYILCTVIIQVFHLLCSCKLMWWYNVFGK